MKKIPWWGIKGSGEFHKMADKKKKKNKMDSKTETKIEVTEDAKTTEEVEMSVCKGCNKTKERTEKEYKDLQNRLSRIEGQVRGIRGMLEKNAYCTDILIQVAAVNAALNSFNKVLLSNHIRTCVAENIRAGNDEIVDELVTLLQKLMK